MGEAQNRSSRGPDDATLRRYFPSGCTSRDLLEHVTSLWGVIVLAVLAEGPCRWGELRRRVEGVSEKMLSQTLRTLAADGLVVRTAHPEVPPRVEYHLSPDGEEVTALLLPLVDWAVRRAGEAPPGAPAVCRGGAARATTAAPGAPAPRDRA